MVDIVVFVAGHCGRC